jgi:subtilisin family serine protease
LRNRLMVGVFFLLVCGWSADAAPALDVPPDATSAQARVLAGSRLISKVRTPEDFERAGLSPAEARRRCVDAHRRIDPMRVRSMATTGFAVLGCANPMHASRTREELLATGDYEFVIPDALLQPAGTPNDPYFGRQWHLTRTSAPTAWGLTVGQRQVTLALVDTGIDKSHPDLRGTLVPGFNAVDQIAEASGGLTDDVNGHGTETAGIAAAVGDNSAGICGVTWDVRVMPIRASNSPGGAAFMSDIIEGIGWAVSRGARVVSVGYEGVRSEGSEYVGRWVRQMGALLVWPAENVGDSYDGFDWPNVIIVGGTDQQDRRASFSCYGRAVDLAAPAVSIFTTRRGGLYGAGNGNSYSAPQVAATLALMLSVAPELSPAQAEAALRLACSPLDTSSGLGAGLLDVSESVRLGSRLDFNRDGFIDFFDFGGFVDAFERGVRQADINNDGFIDFFDYDWFIRLYESTW